jgi:YD repeat-containing protein
LVQSQRGEAPASDDPVSVTSYSPFGDIRRTVLPEGNVVEYGYDAAGRLISVERRPDLVTRGERTLYTLNGAGQRIRQEQQRWTGSGWQSEYVEDYVYTSRCHLQKILHADGSTTELAYDCENRLEKVWDANHPSGGQLSPPSVQLSYDVLDRLITVTQPWGGVGGGSLVVAQGYDAQDNLVRLEDGNGTVTRYVFSDRGLLTQEISETSGTTTFVYSEHGMLATKIDARGVQTQYGVDAADRVIRVDHPGEELDVEYIYDDPAVAFSKGRQTAIVRDDQRVDFAFDRLGRTIRDGGLFYA